MRWQDLFDDLEGRLRAAERQERLAEAGERTRIERSRVTLSDRIAASTGRTLTVSTPAGPVHGELADVGRDWMVIEEQGRRSALVPLAQVTSVVGLAPRGDDDRGMGRRFGLGHALRAISRDRAPVAVHDRAGGLSTGTIDVVGADYLELAEHPADAVRRPAAVTGRRIIAVQAVVVVRRAG